jgi:hypothetical protein
MLAEKTSKNQLTLPGEITKEFPGINYFAVSVSGRKIILTPVRMTPADAVFDAVRDKIEKLGIRPAEIEEAIKWVRSGKRKKK